MTINTEPQIQAIVRRVVAKFVRALGDERSASLLDSADPTAIAELGPLINEAFKAWEKEANIVALKEGSIMWVVRPKLEVSEIDGPLIHLSWGWDNEPRLTMMGEDAFDLAVDILELFSDENGDPVRPELPEYEGSAEISNHYKNLEPLGQEYESVAGVRGYSFLDLKIWSNLGKPNPIPKHQWVDYPDDGVRICEACNHWHRTNGDDFAAEVCPGKPVDYILTISEYDPRRSPQLREAHRLDKLFLRMQDCGATTKELDPIMVSLARAKDLLTEEEAERFEKERVGL